MTKDNIEKGAFPALIQEGHEYVFSTGTYCKQYFYKDVQGNYYRYSNAPEEHDDHDPLSGVPVFIANQPEQSKNPGFFTPDGKKRHLAVPPELTPDANPTYKPTNPESIWYEVFALNGSKRYVYLEADLLENLDLYVQYQLRVTDARIPKYREYAAKIFERGNPKDKVVGAMLMLADQGLFELEELVNATVGDLVFIDNAVSLLGRKFVCDDAFTEFLTIQAQGKDPETLLFQVPTAHGIAVVGLHYLGALFNFLRIQPTYLLSWHASHIFSKVVNRLSESKLPPEELEAEAVSELRRIFQSSSEVQYLVDCKVREKLLASYNELQEESPDSSPVEKSLTLARNTADSYGVLTVLSDLTGRTDSEQEFSTWLHNQPMHTETPESEEQAEKMVADADPKDGSSGPTDAGERDVGTTDAGEDDVGVTDKKEEPNE